MLKPKTHIVVTTAAALLNGELADCANVVVPEDLCYTSEKRLAEHPWEVIVAHNGKKITGILTFTSDHDLIGARPGAMWMQFIDVETDHQNLGIGRRMMNTLFGEALKRQTNHLFTVFYSGDGERYIEPIVNRLRNKIRSHLGKDLQITSDCQPI